MAPSSNPAPQQFPHRPVPLDKWAFFIFITSLLGPIGLAGLIVLTNHLLDQPAELDAAAALAGGLGVIGQILALICSTAAPRTAFSRITFWASLTILLLGLIAAIAWRLTAGS